MLTLELSGHAFHGITVMKRASSSHGHSTWLCRCGCGCAFVATGTALKSGRQKSCAACESSRKVAAAKTHGLFGTPEYRAWAAMKQRCVDRNHRSYPRYGGRGIRVCDRWLESFEHFLADMGPRPSASHSVDRINRDGNYEPGNCRWATLIEQANNRSNNNPIEINGKTQNLTQWSLESGVNRTVILRRLKRGLHGSALIAKALPKLVSVNGVTDTIAGWSRRTGLKASTIAARIRSYGWSPARAISAGG